MKTAICTVFEKDYHYGVGALVNSLHHHGFKGICWAGYRGKLPSWAKYLKTGAGYEEFTVSPDCAIRFIEVKTNKHLGFYKPDFMSLLWQKYCCDMEALFYFDPDIVNKCKWNFYENWVSRGIAICGDSWYLVPANHPRRLAWKEFAESNGFICERQLDYHYNSGFIGIPKQYQSVLTTWQNLQEIGEKLGYSDLTDLYGSRTFNFPPYLYGDQTYLNLALMLNNYPLSTVGPDGMDFIPGGTIMSHATVPNIKPWRKKLMLSALLGSAPSITDKLYWKHSYTPIKLYSNAKLMQQNLEILLGSAIGRFIRRAPM
ncbi:hypothetical protein CEP10_15265 [Cylindrospermopsis raciborskii S07]|jgi:hypothetical protein|uniref:Uncharacterized protein n=3 Tax=Cylindrospermopsis raciborskii TaxID=77022 RepID=A0A853MD97_9CYAN|nr:hypothetical protein [Cylindrospermopsis raciborskii]MBU6346410.1 hypothetical protein [Cyanobacteria bacterium REEB494]EFA69868.1 conserved hypothetical protein [Cylindrospermopsis raciborskii CS-505]MBA4446112.1 hypothetical protein [Cylindrospermopsis raciborskii CS-506_C]MBA4450344.1 hypothetical protein [Cylindrospermopsis raciborskii CS-506_D]MBA4456967.1 hypothetical protein [Cylindrospermopsis raciborskii CS-506_B]